MENGNGEAVPRGGADVSLGLVQPWPHGAGASWAPCFSQPSLGFVLWPVVVLEAALVVGTAKWVAQEADSEQELNLAPLNHPAEETAALQLQKELERLVENLPLWIAHPQCHTKSAQGPNHMAQVSNCKRCQANNTKTAGTEQWVSGTTLCYALSQLRHH